MQTKKGRGGKREGSGRKLAINKKVPYNRFLSPNVILEIKKYSKRENVSEAKFIEKTIIEKSKELRKIKEEKMELEIIKNDALVFSLPVESIREASELLEDYIEMNHIDPEDNDLTAHVFDVSTEDTYYWVKDGSYSFNL